MPAASSCSPSVEVKLPVFKSQNRSQSIRKLTSLLAAVVFGLQPVMVFAAGQPLADPADSFLVTSPAANSFVSGTVNSSFTVSDDEQANVSYEIRLYQPNCQTSIGLVATGQVASGNQFSASWSSAGPIQYAPAINDGIYCHEVCVSLNNNGTLYSACNLRQITIRNNNRAPVFTVTPTSPVTLTAGTSWQFDLEASDADGDAVVFGLQTAPAFVSLVPATGVISVNGPTASAGTHNIVVSARDGFGATTLFNFALQINAASVTPPATPPATPPSTPPATPPSTPPATPPATPPSGNLPASLQIISPAEGVEFKGSQNLVSWKASDSDGVKTLKLNYFLKGEKDKAITLFNVTDLTKSEYVWDVTNLPAGEYQISLILEDKLGVVTTEDSDIFKIAETEPGNTTTRPLIINPTPADLAEIKDVRPQIAAKFSAPSDGEIVTDSLKVLLDGNDITDRCEVNATGFVCDLEVDLVLGEHTVKAEVKDDQDRLAEREWSFTILTAIGTSPIPPFWQTLTPQAWLLGLLICCVALLLLFIPWWLYNLWRNRQSEEAQPIEDYAVAPVESTSTNVAVVPQPIYFDPVAESQPAPQQLDPSAFPSYEDYFAAASGSEQPTNVTVNYIPSAETYANTDPVVADTEVFVAPEVDTTVTPEPIPFPSEPEVITPSSAPVAQPVTPVINNITINPAAPVAVSSDPLAPAQTKLEPTPAPSGSDPYAAYGFGVDDKR